MGHLKTQNDFCDQYDLSPIPSTVIDRSGLPIDLQTEKWAINEVAGNFILDWQKPKIHNKAIKYAIKRYILQRIKTVSPKETYNIWNELQTITKTNTWKLLNETDTISATETLLARLLSEHLETLRSNNKTYNFARIRAWYIWCTEQGLPGFSTEVMYDILKIKIPGNPKGLAVMTDDPANGPLTDLEVIELRNALLKDNGPITERACVWACLAFGCNPANFILIRESDYQNKVFENSNYSFAEINIPRIKKRGLRHQRAEFKTRKVDDKLALIFDELIQHNIKINTPPNIPRAFFLRSHPNKSKMGSPLEEYSYHLTTLEFTQLVKKCCGRLGIISHRTGKPLKLTPRRLRYTFATAMVKQGAAAAELADMLDHTDLQHTQVYYNARSTIVDRLDSALAEKLAPIIKQFSGEITAMKPEDTDKRINYQNKSDKKKIHGIGVCGADYLCKLYPPLSCYLCEKFQPYKNAPHNEVLSELTSWRQTRLEQNGENDRIAQQLDEVIYKVAQIKSICKTEELADNAT